MLHNALCCRNILKSNDVRTGLKKPEQEAGTPASEASVATAAAARSTGATTEATAAAAQGTAAAARSTGATTEATAAAAQATAAAARMPGSHGEAAAPAVSAEEADWSAAKAARQRSIPTFMCACVAASSTRRMSILWQRRWTVFSKLALCASFLAVFKS